MSSKLRIAISGKSGCGNSTVSRLLAERLGVRMINYTFHDLAKDRGLEFEELCRLAEDDPQYDLLLDRRQVELAEEGSCVLGSRLAIWLLKSADLKVYLSAPAKVRAYRIANREGLPPAQALKSMNLRDRRDRRRYLRLYQIDVGQYRFADLIVATEKGDQEYVVDKIMTHLRQT